MPNLPDHLLRRFTSETRIAFFTGAGISAESGIPTFRDKDGYWSKYDPMRLASVQGFRADPELVWNWYLYRREKILSVKPNPGHISITKFQKLFPDSCVITQNVDGLHEQAGNQNIYELHGNIFITRCLECSQEMDVPIIFNPVTEGIPRCECGGLARPGVVWFGESLPMQTLSDAMTLVQQVDVLFTIGSSTAVYPAAQIPFDARNNGAVVIEINPDQTPFTSHADLAMQAPAGVAMPQLFEELYAALA